MRHARKTRPLVSVIIPVFNRPRMVAEAADSVLSQDFRDFEIIAVDDGSTDETPRVLGEYGSRITALRQKNQGVSAARNAGVAASSGKYLAFLDSDDLWLFGKLSAQTAYFKNKPGARICQTDEIWIRDGKRANPGKRHRKESGDIFKRSLELCLVSPSAVMMDRRLFDEFGPFDETLPACEDYDLWLKISSRHLVGLVPRPLVIKRGGHGDQLSKTPFLDSLRIASLSRLLESGGLSNRQRREAAAVLRQKCRIWAAGCVKRGRTREAGRYTALARKHAD
ncbi:Glycosyl transferase [Candidatus Desulfarcum epimagneticum]|uniref:Glycosyl transferase n=1 Tax=uncultured Desulfobacteraceae bacterium TaxID=218296 RepID=A0A484HIS2_9BACT|nr:Glycosyl transferase [uncultured Desulfobacteraceae bacterium]